MVAKGNRSQAVTDACKKHGGFYLGSIGGPAARLAQDCIKKVEVLEYPELGMEAVWRIEVEDFPAFVVVDDKGNELEAGGGQAVACGDAGGQGDGGRRAGDDQRGDGLVEERRVAAHGCGVGQSDWARDPLRGEGVHVGHGFEGRAHPP